MKLSEAVQNVGESRSVETETNFILTKLSKITLIGKDEFPRNADVAVVSWQ